MGAPRHSRWQPRQGARYDVAPMGRTFASARILTAVLLLAACKKAPLPADQAASSCPTCVVATDHGFVPSRVIVPKGAPGSTVALTFTRETDDTCALDIVFPELGIKKALPLKQAVTVEVPSGDARTLGFQCGMAMYKSSVIVQ